MISRAMDLIFIDSVAFVINVTLGTVLRRQICNYSWDGNISDKRYKEKVEPYSYTNKVQAKLRAEETLSKNPSSEVLER
ncbi:hypothetical protein NIES4074_29000 [Cylindrospermum sp. NIES-4074]|nr:hypothetical protein NIES4074_29000 [Cylindrospermum sp. NIES-4074]